MASQSQFDLAVAGQLTEKIHSTLTEKECSIFNRGLADYHKRKSIKTFVECLSLVLNTGYKRKLLIPIREAYVKPSDLVKFNQLVQAQGLATSYRQRQKNAEKSSLTLKEGIKKVEVKRDASGDWGFSIRGGSEHGLGIFVSWIEPGSHAEKSGLQVGDQILKANDTNFNNINHYDAVTVIQNAKKLQLHILAHGRVPGSRMAHKVYHWVDPEGRPCSPPPDPFEIQDKAKGRDYKLINEADERKVTIIIDKGKDLGISIRGGIEHGLGIYISAVEEDSVAESYGLKIGDQILEVNGVSFSGIVHSDAANALRSQSCMVMKIKDVGKLPLSRITTYSNTKWYSNSQPHGGNPTNVQIFKPGVGSQVMLGQQQSTLMQGHGLLKDIAKSVLTEQDHALFMYHITQYQQYDLPVEELVPPILSILNNPEKLQLLAELRGLIKPQDIERFNELTVHKEIMAKKYGSQSPVGRGGRDNVPQKLSPDNSRKNPTLSFSTPGINGSDAVDSPWGTSDLSPINSPQPIGGSLNTSIIEARVRSETENRLRNEFEEKQKKMLEEQHRILEENQAKQEEEIRKEREAMEKEMKQKENSLKAEIEDSIRIETERELSVQLQEKERILQEEKERLIREEQAKEEQFGQLQEQLKLQLEERIWKEADEKLREEYEQKRQQEREASLQRRTKVSVKAAAWDVEGRIKRDLENRIRKEYEDKLNSELRKLKQQENLEREKMEEELRRKKDEEIEQLEAEEQSRIELEEKIRREAEQKVRAEFEARLQTEAKERVKLAEEVKARKSAEERLQRERTELQLERERQEEEFQKEREQERAEREKAMASILREKDELERQLQTQNQQRTVDSKIQLDEQKRLQQEQRQIEEQRQLQHEEKERQRRQKMEQQQLQGKKLEEKKKLEQQKRHQSSESESSDGEEMRENEPAQMTPAELQEQQQLEQQRRMRMNKEREEQQHRQQQVAEEENERKQQQLELAKKKELERKREENIRKREENLRKKEEERRLKELEKKENQPSPSLSRDPRVIQEKEKRRQEAERIAAVTSGTNGGVEDNSLVRRKKAKKAKDIEEERRKAEERLQRKLKRAQEKKKASDHNIIEVPDASVGKSYAGFTDLHGSILHIEVTKVVKKLGIAIDGGANTKQKAVIIREIAPEGCAAITGMGMAVNQQILQVNDTSLFGLKHRDVVMEIKTSFEGPMNKTIKFVVLDSSD